MHLGLVCSLACWFNSVSVLAQTTTGVYDPQVQDPDPISLGDGGPLWTDHATTTEKSKFQNRALNFYTTDRTRTNLNNPIEDDDEDEEADEFQPGALKEFLDSYAEKLRKNKHKNKHSDATTNEDSNDKPNSEDTEEQATNGGDKSKSWDVLNIQKHKHPSEDKNGWVSLEPIPWSISKISKWQSHYQQKPYDEFMNDRPWDNQRPWDGEKPYDNQKPWDDRYGDSFENQQRPSYPSYKKPYDTKSAEAYSAYKFSDRIGIRDDNDVYYINKPQVRPSVQKPLPPFTKYNSQKIEVHGPDYNRPETASHLTQRPFGGVGHRHDDDCRNKQHGSDIITDGMAPNFPSSHEFSRRRGTEMHPESHPFNGQGEWVLLSTTKGYKFNPGSGRQRSLKVDPDSIGAHRSVRLTVLPPLKNSKVNMTTSHGGLLQVESTFQTVEQAHREYKRKQIKKLKKKKRPQKAKPTKQVAMQNAQGNRVKKPANNANNNNKKFSAQGSGNYNSHKNQNMYANRFPRPTKQLALTTTRRNSGAPDSSAVLAAVGAGMIPATMAMLVPIALNGKRRKRELKFRARPSPRFIDTRLVESTFQTVEQAHREYKRKQIKKLKKKKRPQKAKPTKQVAMQNSQGNRVKKPTNNGNNNNKKFSAQGSGNYNSHKNQNMYANRFPRPTKQLALTTTRRNSGAPDSSAVLAAVGAGMIPATMAMLVPIALNGKRRKRELKFRARPSPRFIDTRLVSSM